MTISFNQIGPCCKVPFAKTTGTDAERINYAVLICLILKQIKTA